MPRISIGDCQLYYERQGAGFPVLFVTGLGGNASHWREQAPVFAKSFDTIAFDHRGIGQSDHDKIAYTVDKMADDALPDDFVDRFAIVGPVEHCVERLVRLVALGIGHFHTVGVIFDADAEEATRHLFVSEVMPAVRRAANDLGSRAAGPGVSW